MLGGGMRPGRGSLPRPGWSPCARGRGGWRKTTRNAAGRASPAAFLSPACRGSSLAPESGAHQQSSSPHLTSGAFFGGGRGGTGQPAGDLTERAARPVARGGRPGELGEPRNRVGALRHPPGDVSREADRRGDRAYPAGGRRRLKTLQAPSVAAAAPRSPGRAGSPSPVLPDMVVEPECPGKRWRSPPPNA